MPTCKAQSIGVCMANNHDWALRVVGDLLDGYGADPDASVLGLLALGYGQSVPVLLQAQWRDFDLHSGVWWVSDEVLPVTAPYVVLLKLYRSCCAGQNDRLFVGRRGGSLGKAEANARVRELLREFFNLSDLCAMAIRVCPDLAAAEWRVQRLRDCADLGATAEQVEALEREFNRRRCSLLEAWHGDVLRVAAAMSARALRADLGRKVSSPLGRRCLHRQAEGDRVGENVWRGPDRAGC